MIGQVIAFTGLAIWVGGVWRALTAKSVRSAFVALFTTWAIALTCAVVGASIGG